MGACTTALQHLGAQGAAQLAQVVLQPAVITDAQRRRRRQLVELCACSKVMTPV